MDSLGPDTPTEEPGVIKRIFLIPCMRNSVMYAIAGGTGVFLTNFLLTSNVARSGKYGSFAYFGLLFGTWGVCRYQNMQQRVAVRRWEKSQHEKSGEPNYQKVDPKDV